MRIQMHSGMAVKYSGAKGKKPVAIMRAVEIIRDLTALHLFNTSKYYPHNGERKAAREMRNHERRA